MLHYQNKPFQNWIASLGPENCNVVSQKASLTALSLYNKVSELGFLYKYSANVFPRILYQYRNISFHTSDFYAPYYTLLTHKIHIPYSLKLEACMKILSEYFEFNMKIVVLTFTI